MNAIKKGIIVPVLLLVLFTGCVRLPGPGERDPSPGETGPAQTQLGEAPGAPETNGSETVGTAATAAQTTAEAVSQAVISTTPAASTEAAAQCLEDVADSLNTLGALLSDLDDISESDLEIPES